MRFHDDFYEIFAFYIKNLRRICYSCLNGLYTSSSWYIRTSFSEKGTRSFLYNNIYRPSGRSFSGNYEENEIIFEHSTRAANNSLVYFPKHLEDLQKLVNFKLVPFNLGSEFKEGVNEVLTNSEHEYKNSPSLFLSANPGIVKVVSDRAGESDCYIFLIPAIVEIIFSDPIEYSFSSPSNTCSNEASFQKGFKKPLEVYLRSNVSVLSYYMKTGDNLYTQVGTSYNFDFYDNFDMFDSRVKKFRRLNSNLGSCAVCYFENNVPTNRYLLYPHISAFSEEDFYFSFIDLFVSHFVFLRSLFSSVFRSPKYVLQALNAALKDMGSFRYN